MNTAKEWIKLTTAHIDHLKAERQRTGIGSIALLKDDGGCPDGLNSTSIERWLSGQKRTQKSHYDYVHKLYSNLPDHAKRLKRPLSVDTIRTPVDDELREKLRRIHTQAPLKYLDHGPEDITPLIMAHILSGRDKTISKAALEFMLSDLSKLTEGSELLTPDLAPDSFPSSLPTRPSLDKVRLKKFPGTEYVEITDEIYFKLHNEMRRTCVSPKQILLKDTNAPKGLRKRTIDNWVLGKVRTAEKEYIEYLLNKYTNIPSKN